MFPCIIDLCFIIYLIASFSSSYKGVPSTNNRGINEGQEQQFTNGTHKSPFMFASVFPTGKDDTFRTAAI